MERQQLQMLRQPPIEGGADRLGLRVTRHHCPWPFHDDTHSSLSFLVRKDTFKCFVCGKAGGNIDLVMGILHVGFIDACRWLDNEHNVVLTQWKPCEKPQTTKPFDTARYERFFQQPWLSDEARRFLFQKRRIDPRAWSGGSGSRHGLTDRAPTDYRFPTTTQRKCSSAYRTVTSTTDSTQDRHSRSS